MAEIIIPTRDQVLGLLEGASKIPFSPNFVSVDKCPPPNFNFPGRFNPSCDYKLASDVRVILNGKYLSLFQRTQPNLALIKQESYPDFFDDSGKFIGSFKQKKELHSAGFLDRVDFPIDRTDIVRQRFRESPMISAIYLFPTDVCNLKCVYCNVEHNMDAKPKSFMTPGVAEKAIDLFISALRDQPQNPYKQRYISFYGGEPLLNKKTLFHAIEYSQRRLEENGLADIVNICLMTNGTLVNQSDANFLGEHNVNLTISFDGLKKHHDSLRLTHEDKGSFDKTLEGYMKLREKCPVIVLCTVGNHNVDDLEEIADFFGNHLQPSAVEFSPVRNLKFGTNPAGISSLEDLFEKLYVAHRTLIKKGIPDNNFSRRILCLANRLVYSYHLARCGDILYVSPEGKLYPCDSHLAMKAETGLTVESPLDDIKNNSTQNSWFNRHPFNMGECLSCTSISLCGGGCPYNVETVSGTINKRDTPLCKLDQFVTTKIIRELTRSFTK